MDAFKCDFCNYMMVGYPAAKVVPEFSKNEWPEKWDLCTNCFKGVLNLRRAGT